MAEVPANADSTTDSNCNGRNSCGTSSRAATRFGLLSAARGVSSPSSARVLRHGPSTGDPEITL